MMTFKEFLLEDGNHKKAIEVDEAVRLINAHCRDALANKTQLYRGMTPGADAYVLHGEASTRKSANTSNYYTVILDHFLPADGFPKRGQSIILSNDVNTAAAFGRVYAIFPYDGVKIGVCSQSDLWFSPAFDVGKAGDLLKIQRWNDVWAEYGLTARSFEDFVMHIKEKMKREDDKNGQMLRDIFGEPDNVVPALKKAYSAETLDLKVTTSKSLDRVPDNREMWIGGSCVAIDKHVWDKMKHDEHDNEEAPED